MDQPIHAAAASRRRIDGCESTQTVVWRGGSTLGSNRWAQGDSPEILQIVTTKQAVSVPDSWRASPAPSTDRLAGHVHRRFNPLTGEWVLLSAGRTARPWQGAEEPSSVSLALAYDPGCYLCPGNSRASGERNPDYSGVDIFNNDFPALRPTANAVEVNDGPFVADSVRGTCRVICYSGRHSQSLGELPTGELKSVVEAGASQTVELGDRYAWVQIFENRGAAMGASNPHPHGQIWAISVVPREGVREDARQRSYLAETGRHLPQGVRATRVERTSGG